MSPSSQVIYLDSNATTPVLPLAQEAAQHMMQADYGNPSSAHSSGIQAKVVMEQARQYASALLGADQGKLLFTSGATEGIQTAIFSALLALRDRKNQGENMGTDLLYGSTEHKAVPESLHHWNQVLQLGFNVIAIPVDEWGRHDLAFLKTHIGNAGLVCTMAANNETGVISELDKIETLLQDSQAYWLVDGVQALGKLRFKLNEYRIDYSTFSGHKLYALKGIGLFYVRNGAPFTPLLAGGGQESNLRSGTENMVGIASLGVVIKAVVDSNDASYSGEKIFQDWKTIAQHRFHLYEAVKSAFPNVVLNAPLDITLPTTLNFSVPGLSSKELLDLFDAANVRVSAGSACSASKSQPSFVLEAMHMPEWRAASAVRMSIGPATSVTDIQEACHRIRACGEALRKTCMVTGSIEPLPAEGVIQLSFGFANTWMIADQSSQQCVIIDVLPELIERITNYVKCQNYQVLGVLSTQSHPKQSTVNHAFIKELDNKELSNDLLPNTSSFPIVLGSKVITHQVFQEDHTRITTYFMHDKTMRADEQVCFAFCGDLFYPAHLAQSSRLAITQVDAAALSKIQTQFQSMMHPKTLLCAAHDEEKRLFTTIASSHADYLQQGTLPAKELAHFLATHPNSLLVDVREPYEQYFTYVEFPHHTPVIHVPLSRLGNSLVKWLNDDDKNKTPHLIFFCRTSNRSSIVMQCLRRLGYENAWHLGGGLALYG